MIIFFIALILSGPADRQMRLHGEFETVQAACESANKAGVNQIIRVRYWQDSADKCCEANYTNAFSNFQAQCKKNPGEWECSKDPLHDTMTMTCVAAPSYQAVQSK